MSEVKKILVASSKGNLGKSTLSRELLEPNLTNNPLIIELETTNNSSLGFKGIDVERFNEVSPAFTDLIMNDDRDLIIDTGASTIHTILQALVEHDYAFEDEISAIFIPTELDSGILNDTYDTIKSLNSLETIEGVRKIVVFNKMNVENIGNEAHKAAIKMIQKLGAETDEDMFIPTIETLRFFTELKTVAKTVESDKPAQNAYKQKIKEAKKEGKDTLEMTEKMSRLKNIERLKQTTSFIFEQAFQD